MQQLHACVWFNHICDCIWKISPNVTSNIYHQNEEWKLPINFTVIKICSSHVELQEPNLKYFESSVTQLQITQRTVQFM